MTTNLILLLQPIVLSEVGKPGEDAEGSPSRDTQLCRMDVERPGDSGRGRGKAIPWSDASANPGWSFTARIGLHEVNMRRI